MIDFDKELTKYQPKTEVSAAEDAIHKTELTDLIDILKERREQGKNKDLTKRNRS
ncbi:hypothetical protein ACKX2L_05665 [Lachnospiraceae bacterium YH-ros2228]|jgi:hypothetical protein|nr:hypothetical protein [Lachnospiraceae bacterium]MDD6449021.1 hypothetical protein [Lachnospiraceae bacterium]MDD6451185.1 hypothetical protein [Lachnospiraceae bacterium]